MKSPNFELYFMKKNKNEFSKTKKEQEQIHFFLKLVILIIYQQNINNEDIERKRYIYRLYKIHVTTLVVMEIRSYFS
jgi:hypothetical protein